MRQQHHKPKVEMAGKGDFAFDAKEKKVVSDVQSIALAACLHAADRSAARGLERSRSAS